MARRGNTSASALIRSAQAAYERSQTYNDNIASYEFDLSAKTPEDFNKYSSYLKDRASKVTDPSKALSLDRTLTSAYRTFNSAEIGRASTDVAYGAIDNRTKYSQMLDLYQRARDNGDSSLAQGIEGQLARLSMTIQNEEQAAAGRATGAYKKAYTAQERELNTDLQRYDALRKTGGISGPEYRLEVGRLIQTKVALLDQKRADENLDADAQSAAEQAYNTLISSSEFFKYASPDVQQKVARGENFAATYTDPVTGQVSDKNLNVTGQVKTANGQLVNTYETGFIGADKKPTGFVYVGNTNGNADTKYADVYNEKDLPGADPNAPDRFYYIQDGKKIIVNPDKNANVKRVPEKFADVLNQSESKGITLADTLKATPGLDKVLESGRNATVSAATSGIPGAGLVVNNLMNRYDQVKAQAAEAKATALAQESARTKFNNVIAPATPAIPRLNAPLKPIAPASQVFGPTTGLKPAQNFQAAAGSGPRNEADIARGIGAAAGYNPSFLANAGANPTPKPQQNLFGKIKSFLGF